MAKKINLSQSITEKQFDNGYWYALEIKEFARKIGIPSFSKLRKDELEKSIKHFLRTGKIKSPTKRKLSNTGIKDSDKGLKLMLPIVNYTHNKETKDFIVAEAKKIVPILKEKSGVRLRLSRWREGQIEKGTKITYGDLVQQYLKLNKVIGKFPQLPSGRYINFLSDFLVQEKNSTREDAVNAWKQLKKLDSPKNYQAWKKYYEQKNK